MSAIEQLYGIGKSKVVCTPSEAASSAPPRTFIFPLTEQGGFRMLFDDNTITQRFISIDTSLKSISERQIVIDGFGNFFLSWAGIPMPYSFLSDCIDLWNIRDRYAFKFYPKYEQYIGSPDLYFDINLIAAEGLEISTSDSQTNRGNYGIKLYFRTTTNIKIPKGQATGVLAGGGSYNAAFEGQGLS